MNSFFIDFSFHDRLAGFAGDFHGMQIYSVDYYEDVERLINDCAKLIKKRDCQITFQTFTGYNSIDLLRIGQEYDGKIWRVEWRRNANGFVHQTDKAEGLPMTRATIKKAVLDAINKHRMQEAKTA